MGLPHVFTQFDRPGLDICPLEEHPDEEKVDRTGYIDTEKLVHQFELAGERLAIYRMADDEDLDIEMNSEIVYKNDLDAMREYKEELAAYKNSVIAERIKKEEEDKKKIEDAVVKEAETKIEEK